MHRRTILAAPALLVAARAGAAEPLDVLTADVRPLSIAGGPRRGLVLDIVAEAARAVGREARFTFLPFSEALERTRTTPGTLMAPLARSPQREALFAWIGRVVDVPQAMGVRRGSAPVDLEGARALARVGVVAGGVQEGFLRERGFANLVPLASARDIATALAAGDVDAWYATATEVGLQFEAIGRPGEAVIGPPIQSAPVWLAGNLDPAGAPVPTLRDALAALERSGAVERTYREYVPG